MLLLIYSITIITTITVVTAISISIIIFNPSVGILSSYYEREGEGGDRGGGIYRGEEEEEAVEGAG